MRRIDSIIVHCSATPNFDDRFDVHDIKKWHVFDNKWDDIGYHYVIDVFGNIQIGRPIEIVGAHCKGNNSHSVGVCMIGTNEYTTQQWTSLRNLCKELMSKYDITTARIFGHNQFSNKTCPGFNVPEWVTEQQA